MKSVLNSRRTLYITLCIVMVCVFTLTIVYAALNTVLKITGNAEVVASNWDIYLDNVQLVGGSVTSNVPTITNKTTASFTTTLTKPGDYYMFTIDVVNNGSIDAMIDSVTKTPTLSEKQAKYLNYIVEYQNGESINTKQLVEANSYVRLKVKLEYRKDLVASDLPATSETLNLAFSVNYVQASEEGTSNVPDNGVEKVAKVVKGDGTSTSDEICIGEECFYVMYSDDDTITMLSKYNLLVGYNSFDRQSGSLLENPTGIQDETAKGIFSGYSVENPIVGTIKFSCNENYWSSTVSSYPAYIYDENSCLYEYVGNYKKYLEDLGVVINEARLITFGELEEIGCNGASNTCSWGPDWVYSTSYWSGSSYNEYHIWAVSSYSFFIHTSWSNNYEIGVRPVIVIDRDLI